MIEKCLKKQQNRSKIPKNFPGGACPQTPLATVRFALGPPTENKEPPIPESGYGLGYFCTPDFRSVVVRFSSDGCTCALG